MRFAPQRRAILPHLHKIGPRMRCFVHFDLKMCFATAAWHFSFLCWTATSVPAALASLLFEHPEPRIIEKTQRFATFVTFRAFVSSSFWLAHTCDFFLRTWLLYSAFQLSILSEVRLLNFLWLCGNSNVKMKWIDSWLWGIGLKEHNVIQLKEAYVSSHQPNKPNSAPRNPSSSTHDSWPGSKVGELHSFQVHSKSMQKLLKPSRMMKGNKQVGRAFGW